jgi:hypothetical protein
MAFAREGASAVVADIAEAGNQETARLIKDPGGREWRGRFFLVLQQKLFHRCSAVNFLRKLIEGPEIMKTP